MQATTASRGVAAGAPLPRRAWPPAAQPGLARDRLDLTVRRDGQAPREPQSVEEAAAEGAAEGARLGGLVGNIAIAGLLFRAGIKGVSRIPAGSVFGRVMPYVGAVFSAAGLVMSGAALIRDLRQPELQARPIAGHSLELASHLAIGAGTAAIIAGATVAPWLLVIGTGFLLSAAAGLIHRDRA